jgi:ubiquinone/menaquinone biosynthesis C-methylase UbiE
MKKIQFPKRKVRSFDLLAPFYDRFIGALRRQMPLKIMSRLNPGDSDVILDIGGGTGFNSAPIASTDRRLIILDISFGMLKQAKKYGHLELVLGDARMLPFKNRCFDVLIAVDSLHHIGDYPRVLAEVKRTGRGKFFVAEFFGRTLAGKLFTRLEKLFFPVVYRRPDQFRMEVSHYGISGDYEYINGFEYFFLGEIY